MTFKKQPSDLARETLRLLAQRKLMPTPDHYTALFYELDGQTPPALFNPSDILNSFSKTAADFTGFPQETLKQIHAHFENQEWDQAFSLYRQSLETYMSEQYPDPKELATLPELPLSSLTASLKDDELPQKAQLLSDLHEQLARFIEFVIPALGEDDLKIKPDAIELADFCRHHSSLNSWPLLKQKLSQFNHRLSFVAEDQSQIKQSLLGMLHLVFQNITELTQDDPWLHTQIELLTQASQPPLTLRRLDDVQRRLQDVIFKQSELKTKTLAAQNELKQLLAQFLERLSSIHTLSDTHTQRLESIVKDVENSKDLSALTPAFHEAIQATRTLSLEAARTRDQLHQMQYKAEQSAAEVDRLKKELDQMASQTRHDILTGALNRKGLEESLQKEISRAERQGTTLSIAFIDIDNFKKLNDVHGHLAGDAALTHLATVARSVMRAQDTLARFGGEEFIILMPDTDLSSGVEVMVKFQRALTREFFMQGNQSLLITFSAGVTSLRPGEPYLDAIERADAAMYQAKQSGKNKVVGS